MADTTCPECGTPATLARWDQVTERRPTRDVALADDEPWLWRAHPEGPPVTTIEPCGCQWPGRFRVVEDGDPPRLVKA